MHLLPVCLRESESSVEFQSCKDLTLVSTSFSACPAARACIFPLSHVPPVLPLRLLAPVSPISSVSLASLCTPSAVPGLALVCKARAQSCRAPEQGVSWQGPGGTEVPVWMCCLHVGVSLPGMGKLMLLSKYCNLLWFGQIDKNEKKHCWCHFSQIAKW